MRLLVICFIVPHVLMSASNEVKSVDQMRTDLIVAMQNGNPNAIINEELQVIISHDPNAPIDLIDYACSEPNDFTRHYLDEFSGKLPSRKQRATSFASEGIKSFSTLDIAILCGNAHKVKQLIDEQQVDLKHSDLLGKKKSVVKVLDSLKKMPAYERKQKKVYATDQEIENMLLWARVAHKKQGQQTNRSRSNAVSLVRRPSFKWRN